MAEIVPRAAQWISPWLRVTLGHAPARLRPRPRARRVHI